MPKQLLLLPLAPAAFLSSTLPTLIPDTVRTHPATNILPLDDALHIIVFAFLSFLLLTAGLRKSTTLVLLSFAGILLELLQPFFQRGQQFTDVMSNTVGIITALVIYHTYQSLRNKHYDL